LAQQLTPEDVQLFYQIAVTSQKELYLAPEPRSGFEMLLLRMLAFRPGEDSATQPGGAAPGNRSQRRAPSSPAAGKPPVSDAAPARAGESDIEPGSDGVRQTAVAADPSRWDEFVAGLKLGGIASQLANNCVFESWDGKILSLRLDPSRRQLRSEQVEARLQEGAARALGRAVKLKITEAVPEAETPAMRQSREQSERQRQAEAAMADDPLVREMEEHFAARLVSDSIRPLD
jgi:DNA polymerase-3 subunit gamma/tau